MVALTTVVERDKIRIVQFGDVYVIPEGGELGQVKWAWHPAIAFRRLKPCLSGAVCRSRRAHCNRHAPRTPRAGRAVEHAGAMGVTLAAIALGAQVPRRDLVAIASDQQRLAIMAVVA